MSSKYLTITIRAVVEPEQIDDAIDNFGSALLNLTYWDSGISELLVENILVDGN